MRVTSIVLTCVLVGLAQARITNLDVVEAEFRSFKEKHQKVYENVEEELKRMQIFMENKKVIDEHNKRYAAGEVTYKMGVNQFTDLLPSEFESQLLSNLNESEITADIDDMYFPDNLEALPSSVDWRTIGAVTPVQNQGRCRSCWAFTAAGLVESHQFIKTRELIPLSVQNLIDCSMSNYGCWGGLASVGLQYIIDNGGIDTAESYPFEGKDGECHFKSEDIGAKVVKVVKVDPNENALEQAVALKGPVGVEFNVTTFRHYESGVYDGPCGPNHNHEMIVVGYTRDYWILKNSWGTEWGEKGYFRLSRNHNNMCGIANLAKYPIV